MSNQIRFYLLVLFYLFDRSHANELTKKPLPIVMWHGMGDSCCNPNTMGYFKNLIEQLVDGIYVHSIQIGNNMFEDQMNGFFMDVNEKIEMACNKIQSDPKLANGYNAIGFSQGSQFLRAVAQRCSTPSMHILISIGGQHQGVFGLPNCLTDDYFKLMYCSFMRSLVSFLVHFNYIQKNIVQASYWHDPFNNEINYSKYNLFLADINQVKTYNPKYRENMLKLKALVLVKFNLDQMVIPGESQWFGFYKKNNISEIYKMEESEQYLNDTLGLRSLDESGRIFKYSLNSGHLQMTQKWFIDKIINKFLI